MLKLINRLNDIENISKLIFSDNDIIVETTIFGDKDHALLYFSVQSGCMINCNFCGTRGKFIRNLTTEEIEFQIETGLEILKKMRPDGYEKIELLAMSMGEPMLNWVPTEINACKYLDQDYYVTISTVGIRYRDIINRMIRIGQKYPKFSLQFSLHKTSDIDRLEFIGNKKISYMYIREMVIWAKKFNYYNGGKTRFNYIVTGKETDEDIKELIRILTGMHLVCSVLCDINGFTNIDSTATMEFFDKIKELSDNKIELSVYNPKGQDTIGSGCGQLLQIQERFFPKN